jgi:hypothetical protein
MMGYVDNIADRVTEVTQQQHPKDMCLSIV